MPRRVQFSEFGDLSVLNVVEFTEPTAGPGQVRVRVHAAGLNPVDFKIAAGSASARRFNITLPSGNGNDFAGIIDQVGNGVSGFSLGDLVAGGQRFHAQAEFVIVEPARLAIIPDGVSFEVAGSLDIAARTAWQSVDSMTITAADRVLVSSAAGGVGILTAQLLRIKGATVIGTASQHNHAFLRSLGIHPMSYEPDLIQNLRSAAPQGITAVFDTHGAETISAALAVGVPASRINTTAAKHLRDELGIKTVGQTESDPRGLAEVLDLIACKDMTVPIHATFAIENVADAYAELKRGHARGKIVLLMPAYYVTQA